MPQLRPEAAKQINITGKKAQELKTKNHEQVECGLTYIIESEASFQAGRDFRHYLNQTCKLAQAWRPKVMGSRVDGWACLRDSQAAVCITGLKLTEVERGEQ